MLDFPGFGESSFPNRDLTIYDYGYLIKDFIKILNIDNPVIIGHSFGSRIVAILVGMLNFIPQKLIIIDGAGIKRIKKISYYIKTYFYKFLKLLRYFLKKQYRQKYLDKLSKTFGSSDYNQLDSNMKKTFVNVVNEDLSLFYKNIKQDTLILWGECDIDTPIKNGKKIERLIDNSELIVLKDATHFSYIDSPTLTNNIIYAYLEDLIEEKN
ncbi:MAG TPA: alpha/beta hydrolase [Bacilli bacterium]|nr:alpha/beta hydrolase [Bacilli bacterium]